MVTAGFAFAPTPTHTLFPRPKYIEHGSVCPAAPRPSPPSSSNVYGAVESPRLSACLSATVAEAAAAAAS